MQNCNKVITGDLTNVAQDLMHYFDTRGGTTLITTLILDYQEAIQFPAAENVKDHCKTTGWARSCNTHAIQNR